MRNVLTNVLGVREQTEIHVSEHPLRDGEMLLLCSDGVHNVRWLPHEAGLAAAYGLPKEAALRAVTLAPAEILGVADSLGSLDEGKIANVVVADGDGVIVVPRQHAERVATYARETLDGDKSARRRLYQQLGLPEDESVR